MKVLQLIQKPQLRGAEVFTAQLSTHLNKLGHETLIVPLFDGMAALPYDGKILSLKGDQKKKYWDFRAWKKLAQIIKEENPQIIQANAGDTLKYAVFSKMLFRWKQPIVFRNASTISLYIKSPFVKRLYHFLFSKTKQIISVSQASAKDFEQLYPSCQNKIVTIPIGIEVNEPVLNKTFQNPFKQKTGIESQKLIHVGGFTFEKNHKGLVNIFEIILQKSPNATLHLIGDGPLRNDIENLVQARKLSDKVFFEGFQQNPLQWIQQADVLLLPSHIEGLPGVILEAFYCRTPVVAYNTGGIGEVVKNLETGYLIEKGNEALFAEAVLNTLNEDEQKDKMIENAFSLVSTQYMNGEVAKGFLNIYKSIL